MQSQDVIFVAGGDTLIGAALLRQLRRQGYPRVLGGSTGEPDLTDPRAVDTFLAQHHPAYVFLASGRSGGIALNMKQPADLMHDNLLTTVNLLQAAHTHKVRRLLFLASSCSYPRLCPQPMRVEHLTTGPLEPTNEAYATAKIAGIRLCQAYRQQYGDEFVAGIPADAFGLEDDFFTADSHVVPALLHRMHTARIQGAAAVTVWGTGQPRREFILADDLAEACLHVIRHYTGAAPINLGSGHDISIGELAHLIRAVVGYPGEIRFDTSKPDGMPYKALDSQPLAALGWRPPTPLKQALAVTYEAYLKCPQP